jgi:hypothetical protein
MGFKIPLDTGTKPTGINFLKVFILYLRAATTPAGIIFPEFMYLYPITPVNNPLVTGKCLIINNGYQFHIIIVI